MAFRPPSLRTPRPRSPVNRPTRCGREVLFLLAVVVAMLVLLLSVNTSAINGTLRLIRGFTQTQQDDPIPLLSRPEICVHAGIDTSLSSTHSELLERLGIVSISDRISLMCHRSISELSVQIPLSMHSEILTAYPRRICCLDLDVFFVAEGFPVVGRPDLIARRLMAQHQFAGGNNDNTTGVVTTSDVRDMEKQLIANRISWVTLSAADPQKQLVQPLSDIVAVIGAVVASDERHTNMGGVNATRVTLELKATDVSPASKRSGPSAVVTPAPHDSSPPILTALTHPIYVADAAQRIAYVLSHSHNGIHSKGYALWEYFGVIIDPLRFPSVWNKLMDHNDIVVQQAHGGGGGAANPPEGFSVLMTQPQLWYLMPMKDVVLSALATKTFSEPKLADVGLTAEAYCQYLIAPPAWARELMPSVAFLQRCVKWFRPHVDPDTRAITMAPRSGGKEKRSAWRLAHQALNRTHKHLVSWIVDDISQYDRVVELGERHALRSSFVVSNNAQRLAAQVHQKQ